MAGNNETIIQKTITMISEDAELVRLAKGAIADGDEIQFVSIQKKVSELGAEIRDLKCNAIIVEIDAGNVADFEELQKINRMVGQNVPIIVISENFSPAAARILIQLKVSDFLVKPLQTSDLVRACNNALKMTGEETQIEPQFLTFMPATGGVGTTVVALETAAILNETGKKFGRTTCVVDLNFQHGSCAEYLDIEPRFDITEIENAPERLDRQLLDVMLSKHESGLSLIAAPSQPSEMRTFKAALVVRLLDLVSAYFDYVIIDLPRIWFPWTETVIMGSNRLFIMADMTVPSIRHAKRLLSAVDEKIGNQIDAKVLVNRLDRRNNVAGLNVSDVEKALGEHYGGGLPNNYRLVRDAVDRGVQLCAIEPNNNLTNELRSVILKTDQLNSDTVKPNKGLVGFGKKLFAKKAG